MLVRNFRLFWRTEEVEWFPGPGRRWRLLGRSGWNNPGLRLTDFRDQRGLYVLYGNYGAHYVGLARDRGVGDRLKDHLSDRHSGKWDRFSWFGFRRVLTCVETDSGLYRLAAPATYTAGNVASVIADMEALLIHALGCPENFNTMSFINNDPWEQVTRYEREIGLLQRAGVEV